MAEEVVEGKDEIMRVVVTVEGNQTEWSKFTTETFLVAADGSTKEAGPKLTRDGENVLVSLFDAGGVLQTLALTTGVAMAIRSNDVLTVAALLKAAKGLGISIADLADFEEAVPA